MRRRLLLGIAMAIALSVDLPACAREPGIYSPVRVARPPTIDGVLDDLCWTGMQQAASFQKGSGVPTDPRTMTIVCFDDSYLYVGVECFEPNPAELRKRARTETEGVFLDDCVEVFMRPRLHHTLYYHFVVNCAGVTYDAIGPGEDGGWTCDWRAKTRVREDGWSVEIAIPLTVVGIGRSESLSLVGLSVCRVRPRVSLETSCWPFGGWFHDPAGHLLFTDYADFLRRELLPEWVVLRNGIQRFLSGVPQDKSATQLQRLLAAADTDFTSTLTKEPILPNDIVRLSEYMKELPAEMGVLKRTTVCQKFFADLERRLALPSMLSEVEARTRRAEAAFVLEDSRFACFKGVQAGVADDTAENGRVARIAVDAPPFFQCSCNLLGEFTRPLLPGLTYDLYLRVKARKSNSEGTAFRYGVYDNHNRRYICPDVRPTLVDVPDNEWRTYHVGTLPVLPGAMAYVGPSANTSAVAAVAVDHFFLVPVAGPDAELSRQTQVPNGAVIPFFFHHASYALAALQFDNAVDLGVQFRVYRHSATNADSGNGYTGFVLDYSLPEGHWYRVALPVPPTVDAGQGIRPNLSLPWHVGLCQEVRSLNVVEKAAGYWVGKVSLREFAPRDWTGTVWLVMVQQNAPYTWTGLLRLPAGSGAVPRDIRMRRVPDEWSGFSQDAIDQIMLQVRQARFGLFCERLSQIVAPRAPAWRSWWTRLRKATGLGR